MNFPALGLTLPDQSSKRQVFVGALPSMGPGIVSALGYFKKPAHFLHWILLSKQVNNPILYA
jgi:hypothetical protein